VVRKDTLNLVLQDGRRGTRRRDLEGVGLRMLEKKLYPEAQSL